MKFGGTSVQDGAAISRVIEIVRARMGRRPVVVVSALSKVTDLLYKICDEAAALHTETALDHIATLRTRHLTVAGDLLAGTPFLDEAHTRISALCTDLEAFVRAVCVVGDLSPKSRARIISCGEVLSSTIICYAMNARAIRTNLVDARKLIITDNCYLKGEPDKDAICATAPGVIAEAFRNVDAVITQGFVSATAEGETTVLGRGGSDYTASLVGMAVGAEEVQIWTDVDGVMTADPRVVEHPVTLPEISFEEAAEMAHFGAKVLHPMTIEPAIRLGIPIWVLDSTHPDRKGTGIFGKDRIADGIKSVSSKENIQVINIFSTKMINTSGFLSRVFGVFSDFGIPVDMISTSEANISVTVDGTADIGPVVERLSGFAEVTVDRAKAQVSVIGKNLVGSGRIFSALASALASHPVYMISQGSSFINLTIVVDRDACRDVVRLIHRNLFENA